MAFPPRFFWALNAFGEEKETPGLFPTGNLGQSHSSALPQGAAREIFPGILMIPSASCLSPAAFPGGICIPLGSSQTIPVSPSFCLNFGVLGTFPRAQSSPTASGNFIPWHQNPLGAWSCHCWVPHSSSQVKGIYFGAKSCWDFIGKLQGIFWVKRGDLLCSELLISN